MGFDDLIRTLNRDGHEANVSGVSLYLHSCMLLAFWDEKLYSIKTVVGSDGVLRGREGEGSRGVLRQLFLYNFFLL